MRGALARGAACLPVAYPWPETSELRRGGAGRRAVSAHWSLTQESYRRVHVTFSTRSVTLVTSLHTNSLVTQWRHLTA